MRRVFLIIAILLLPIVPIVLVVTGALHPKPKTVTPVHLTVWGTVDADKAFKTVLAKYAKNHSYVTVEYIQVRPEDYFQQLVTAWAQGTGPDLYFVPNSWVGQMTQYASPLPPDLSIPVIVRTKGLFGISQNISTPKNLAPALATLQNRFVDVVMNDVNVDGQVWGLPLSMDTIVLYYNKDLLNAAKIFQPAKTWQELVGQVGGNHLTVTDEKNNLVHSGVALGTANNVPYASDILTLLMMQNGATMTTPDHHVNFDSPPGLDAVNFYTSFALSSKATYSWSESQPNAIDAFLQGKVAYFFGTLQDRATISAGSLNWAVTPMLHLSASGDNDVSSGGQATIDPARYQVAMVSKASQLTGKSVYAWNLLNFLSQDQNVVSYLQDTGHLAATRAILNQQKDDLTLGVYANQLLTARSWYHGKNGAQIDDYFSAMITSVINGKSSPDDALHLVAKQVESTL